MSSHLPSNTRIPTRLGQQLRVVRLIGSGGQGDVYEVIYSGEHKALKWYPTIPSRNRAAFVQNLLDNIRAGSPSPAFLWPQDIADFYEGGFGYIMDLRPKGFYEVNDYLYGCVSFPSYRRVIDACMGIVGAFRLLHNRGYVYQDINSKNFFIEPASARVLICDNDNVVPDHTDTGMRGTWGFMAPEIVHGENPSELSDRHSMAVLLFLLLFRIHPLEGVRAMRSMLSDEGLKRIYGEEPLFVFDADDDTNRPDSPRAEALWNELPTYLRELFLRCFSQSALHDGGLRPYDVEWAQALARMRSELTPCPNGCGELVFVDGRPATCTVCGMSVVPEFMINLGRQVGYRIPVLHDARIYACQTHVTKPEHSFDPVGMVLQASDGSRAMGLRNMGTRSWVATTKTGQSIQVPPGEVVPLEEGLAIVGPNHLALTCEESTWRHEP